MKLTTVQRQSYRNTKEELTYYGSDYNKFLNKECNHKMTVINLDCVQYKRSKGIFRIVESKHKNEGMASTQKEIFSILARIFRYLNSAPIGIKFELFEIRGNYPYDEVVIIDYLKGTEYVCKDRLLFKKFSEFELSFEDLQKYCMTKSLFSYQLEGGQNDNKVCG